MTVNLHSSKSQHQVRTELFANKMGFLIPVRPVSTMSLQTRVLLARLILEETFELVERGLGIEVVVNEEGKQELLPKSAQIDPIEVIDGVCDVRFVATKILCIMGVPDEPFQTLVDLNNLMKFSDGHSIDVGGKLIKPSNHPKPEIKRLFEALKNEPHVSHYSPKDS
jgi:predicted HAD superfamily Cof-like phosphohydrolase